ncbi:MAG: PepSY-like domain-containing protein [Bacteroidota bacterium]
MKKILFIAVMSAGTTFMAVAQKLPASKVPDAVRKSFAKEHPGVTAKWENENGQFEAGYKDAGKTMSILYKADGSMTESEVAIKVSALPAPVLIYVKEHYKGFAIKEGAKITKADGTINYEAEVNKMDVLFDGSGRFIKESKD